MAAARLASRALAAWITRGGDRVADALVLEQEVLERRAGPSTRPATLTSGLFSRPLVWPWNCGSWTQTERTAVSPSRMSSRLISIPFLTRSCVFMNRCTAVPTAAQHAQLVGAAVAGRDRVDERADVLVGRLGPGQGEVAAEAVVARPRARGRTAGRRPAGRCAGWLIASRKSATPPSWRNSTLVLFFWSTNWMTRPLLR